jgi:hypothetical protein
VIRLINDLGKIEPCITIRLLISLDLLDQEMLDATRLSSPFASLETVKSQNLQLEKSIPPEVREPLLAGTAEANRCLTLLSTADAQQVDGIVTNDERLINARYPLYQWHRIRIIPIDEFGDTVEIFAHGHSVFWSSISEERYMTFDLFYQRLHSKGYRFARWFFQVEDQLLTNDLRESLRSALLNRYPFYPVL